MMRKIIVTLVAAIIGGAVAYAGQQTVLYTSSGTAPFLTTANTTAPGCSVGTPCNLSSVVIGDGVAGANIAAVKAASTAATGADPALVVTLSPNSNASAGIAANQSGPWTVQPGNTANTTAWLVTGTGGSFPIPANSSMNMNQMGGTSIAAGCTTSLSGAGAAIPATICPTMGTWVLNATAPVGPPTATQSPVLAGSQNVSAVIGTGGGLVIPASGSTKTYVTAWDVIANGTGSVTLFSGGTGSTCTGGTAITGTYNLTAQAGISKGDGSAPVLISAASAGVCIGIGGTPGVGGSITYQQF